MESFCDEKNISVVVEEFSMEACENSNVEASICNQVTRRMQLRHIYCDPVSSERAELAIPSQGELVERVKNELGVKNVVGKESNDYCDQLTAKYHDIRGTFWLTKLAPHQEDNVLFMVHRFTCLCVARRQELAVHFHNGRGFKGGVSLFAQINWRSQLGNL